MIIFKSSAIVCLLAVLANQASASKLTTTTTTTTTREEKASTLDNKEQDRRLSGYGYPYNPYPYYPQRPYYPSYPYYPPYYPPWYPTYPNPPPTPAPPTNVCDAPKVFNECGSACPPTCADPNPGACTFQCVADCFCPTGLVLNQSTDECVPLALCPTVPVPCGVGEVLDDLLHLCVPVSCEAPNACATGLTCIPTSVQCIRAPCPQFTCQVGSPPPVTCTGGKEYRECTSSCTATCDNPTPGPCTLQCEPPGCECPVGSVLDTTTDTCVSPLQCPYTPPGGGTTYTVTQCQAVGGTVVGDPGDGSVSGNPNYICQASGVPPLGIIVGAGFIEGAVCCGSGSGGGSGGGPYYPPWWYGGGGGGGYYGPGYYPGYYGGGYYHGYPSYNYYGHNNYNHKK